MTLTTDELRTLHAARLEQLVSELMAATRDGDPGAFDKASEALVDFRASVPFPDLKTEAANAREAAAAELSSVALAELAKIADRMTAAGAGFKAAAMVAENGKKELLFPTLAATASRGLELFKQFREALDKVGETAGGVDELGDVPAAIEQVLAAFDNLKSKLEAAQP